VGEVGKNDEGGDDVGRVRVKREMQFISMTQKLLEGGEPALVHIGLSVYLGQRRTVAKLSFISQIICYFYQFCMTICSFLLSSGVYLFSSVSILP
jgi:hypothetical protein